MARKSANFPPKTRKYMPGFADMVLNICQQERHIERQLLHTHHLNIYMVFRLIHILYK